MFGIMIFLTGALTENKGHLKKKTPHHRNGITIFP